MQIQKLMKVKGILLSISRVKLPVKASYKLYKLVKAIDEEESFYNRQFREIVQAYAEKGENGQIISKNGTVQIKKDKIDECNNAISALDSLEVSVPDIRFTLGELQEVPLSIQDISTIEEFLQEEM